MWFGKKQPKGYKSIDDAAAELDIHRNTLYRWLARLGIEPTATAAYLSEADIKRIKEEREKESKK